MEAMEKELVRLKGNVPASSSEAQQPSTKRNKGKGKASASLPSKIEEVDEMDEDEDYDMEQLQTAMDQELKSALKREMEVVSSDDDLDMEDEPPMDYNLIKNFLESFKSQQGASGPVGNLAGRLQGADWVFPRDG